MRKNIIAVLRNKLIGIDEMLPMLMEVKAAHPDVRVVCVFLNPEHLRTIQQNYHLWQGIQSLNSEIVILKHPNKLATLFHIVRFILRFSFQRNVVLKRGDHLPRHQWIMSILKKISRTYEIQGYLLSFPIQGHRNLFKQMACSREKTKREIPFTPFKGQYDYFLSVLNPENWKDCYQIDPPCKIIKVGYEHGLPRWKQFTKKAASENHLSEQGPYFLYVLTSLGRRMDNYEEPLFIDLLRESLTVLKKYQKDIKTVFKPHAITDMEAFRKLLKDLQYENYVIDYGHPMILAMNARFILGNACSLTMFDAYYLGKPVVEYSFTDPVLFERIGRQSLGGGICDFFIRRDMKELDTVMGRLILGGPVVLRRDPGFIKENFPETPKEFYELWDKLIS